MNNCNFHYSVKTSVARAVANILVFAGGIGSVWLLLIIADSVLSVI